MKFPWCKANSSKIYDSRLTENGQVKRRRHECLGPQRHRFTTYEVYDGDYETLKKYEDNLNKIRTLLSYLDG